MAKNSETVKRIKKLRETLGKNQLEFAKHGGFPQSRVSEWEAGKTPTADMYIRLAKLAPYPDNLWFWQQAGIDEDAMLSAAGARFRDIGENPSVGKKVVPVPPFRGEGLLWYVDGKEIPAGASPVYYEIGDLGTYGTPSMHGARVLLDVSVKTTANLRPFWGYRVLAEVKEEDRRNVEFPPRRGLHMGWLHFATGEAESVRYAVLGVTSENTHPWTPYAPKDAIAFGRWTSAMLTDEQQKQHFEVEGKESDWDYYDRAAKESMQIFPGCTILGRVLGWWKS